MALIASAAIHVVLHDVRHDACFGWHVVIFFVIFAVVVFVEILL
jgi:hypothetical protein